MKWNKISWLVFTLLCLVAFFVFKDYLLLKKIYLFHDIRSDGHYGFFPVTYSLTEYLYRLGLPKWSFRTGMGQNILFHLLHDPFDIILYIGGKENIYPLEAYKEAIKAVCTGMVFYRYLRIINMSATVSFMGAFSFPFCGFLMATSPWFSFTGEGFNFAVFLLAFELMFQRNKWLLFAVAVFIAAVSMPFNLYLYGVFLITYTIFRHWQEGKLTVANISNIAVKMVGAGILGIMLAAPFFIQNVLQLLNSPRGSGNAGGAQQFANIPVWGISDDSQLGTAILRAFSSDILGQADTYKGWDTVMGAPALYCGLLCLLVIPQVFSMLTRRQRGAFVFFAAVWFLPLVFPYFRRAFWLFTGDYYRMFTLYVTFVLLYFGLTAANYILNERRINRTLLYYTVIILLICVYNPFFVDRSFIVPSVRNFVAFMLVLHTGLLLIIVKLRNSNLPAYLLAMACVFEVGVAASTTTNTNTGHLSLEFLKEKVIYNDYSYDAVQLIQKSDNTFYRIDKNFYPESLRWSGLNFSARQGYNGTTSYSSFNQLYYIKYLQMMGVINKESEVESRYAIGTYDNPVLESQNRVKYFLGLNHTYPQWRQLFDSITTIDHINVFRNKYVLPFGFTYSAYIKESECKKASAFQRQFISMQAAIVPDDMVSSVSQLREMPLADTALNPLSPESFIKLRDGLMHDTLALTHFDDNHFAGSINATAARIIFLSVPYDIGWHVKVDGTDKKIIVLNGGMMGIFVSPGKHDVSMVFELPFWNASLIISLIGVLLCIAVLVYQQRAAKRVTEARD
jgi:uncharacterized membrane protein YfhO